MNRSNNSKKIGGGAGAAGGAGGPSHDSPANKYDDYSEAQLEEFASVVSPKMSELLKEQALALDDLLDAAWSDDDAGGDDSSDDYDSDDRDGDVPPPSFSALEGGFGGSGRPGRRRKGRGNDDDDDDDEDSFDEEWGQLEAAQLDLKDELDAATNGFAQMLYGNDESNACSEDVDCYNTSGSQHSDDGEDGDGGDGGGAEPRTQGEEWATSVHQYYTDNNPSFPAAASNSPDNYHDSYRRNANSHRTSPPDRDPDRGYTLADHARTLSVSRPDRGRYVMPFLSRHELETSGIVKLPAWIARPSGEVSSRGRERYMKRALYCTVEYVEPPKSRALRRLFSGWNPGPGERRAEDDGGGRGREQVVNHGSGGGADGRSASSQRVVAYTPTAADGDEDGDSSDGEDNEVEGFEDIEGMAHHASPRRPMEPLPVRTVTVRIRPDVLCGAVMDALTTSVERVGGEMTKRQGGHLRAALPGRRMRVWTPGEILRENIDENNVYDGGDSATPQRAQSGESDEGSASRRARSLSNADAEDASSVASGISSMLSPILGGSRSSRRRGPAYDVLPPTIIDAQLVTKKVGRECQRLVLIRVYRVRDVARASTMGGVGDVDGEALDGIAPLHLTEDATEPQASDGAGVAGPAAIDPLLESKRSLRALQEASALVQCIKAVGGSGFAVDPPREPLQDDATVTSQTSTKSYLKSFGDAIVSPIRFFGASGQSAVSPMTPMKTPSGYDGPPSPHYNVMDVMSTTLLREHVPSPSVGTRSRSALAAAKQRSHGLFPALSKEDVPCVKSSWIFLRDCVEELDRRRLAYSTLGIYPLFQFPALPTLDVHFVAQIKAFCRESMIVSLVKTASELEIYAREFEVSCGNVEQLLRPTFDFYRMAPPQLPTPVPLTAYPLDFRAPEEICPPWGPEVAAALGNVSNDLVTHSSEANDHKNSKKNSGKAKQNPLSSFERSARAITAVVSAFQRQNDVEQGARLGRKNMQVMDRLAKMQAHKRNSIAKIRASYGTNLLATKAADEFHALRKRSSNVGSLSDVIRADRTDEVPLLTCNVLVGNAAGTCHVTHSHVLFNTQLVPILGGSRIHLFSILDVEVTINAPSKSVLSPLPASISLTTAVFGGNGRKSSATREEVYNFIPSIGARRFAKFLEVLRDVALEDPNSLKFSEKGGLIYLAD